jgi:hypothetical protein
MIGPETKRIPATDVSARDLVAQFEDRWAAAGDRGVFLAAFLYYLSQVLAKETFSPDVRHAAVATLLFDQLQEIIGREPAMNPTPSSLPPEAVSSSLEVTVSPELHHELELLAEDLHGSEGDALAKAVALLRLAVDARKEGKRVAILDGDFVEVDREITGL